MSGSRRPRSNTAACLAAALLLASASFLLAAPHDPAVAAGGGAPGGGAPGGGAAAPGGVPGNAKNISLLNRSAFPAGPMFRGFKFRGLSRDWWMRFKLGIVDSIVKNLPDPPRGRPSNPDAKREYDKNGGEQNRKNAWSYIWEIEQLLHRLERETSNKLKLADELDVLRAAVRTCEGDVQSAKAKLGRVQQELRDLVNSLPGLQDKIGDAQKAYHVHDDPNTPGTVQFLYNLTVKYGKQANEVWTREGSTKNYRDLSEMQKIAADKMREAEADRAAAKAAIEKAQGDYDTVRRKIAAMEAGLEDLVNAVRDAEKALQAAREKLANKLAEYAKSNRDFDAEAAALDDLIKKYMDEKKQAEDKLKEAEDTATEKRDKAEKADKDAQEDADNASRRQRRTWDDFLIAMDDDLAGPLRDAMDGKDIKNPDDLISAIPGILGPLHEDTATGPKDAITAAGLATWAPGQKSALVKDHPKPGDATLVIKGPDGKKTAYFYRAATKKLTVQPLD